MTFDTNSEIALSETRPVTLPCEVDEAKVEATYDNGVLKIKLPKTEESKIHKIKVHKKK